MNTVALTLIGIGGVFIFLNWACLITSAVTKKFHSMVPPLGGLLILIGLLFTNGRQWAWIGLLLDPGFLAIMYALLDLCRQFRRYSESRLILCLEGQSSDLKVRLRLFNADCYQITLDRSSSNATSGWRFRTSFGTWTRNGGRIELIAHTNKDEKPSRAVLVQTEGSDCYEVVESTSLASQMHEAPEFPPTTFRLSVESSQ
ncbi:MAG: hypothetical protein ACK5TH_17715 [Prosthecobacter sp.]